MLSKLTNKWGAELLALLAGSLVTLSLAPFKIWPLGIVSVAIISFLVNTKTPHKAAITGWFYGLGVFGSGVSWVYVSIHIYGYAPAPLATILTVLFCSGLSLISASTFYCYARWLRSIPHGNLLGLSAIIVLSEWVRSWLLTGFPWVYLGYAHIDTPLAGWAPIGGVWAISFIVAYTGALIAALATALTSGTVQYPAKAHIIAVMFLWLGGAIFNQVEWVTKAQQPPVKVSMVQANISQHQKWSREFYQQTLELYRESSASLWSSNDIVIWPEAAIPNYYHNARRFLDQIAKEALANQSTLITGIPYQLQEQTEQTEQTNRSFNSIMAFGNGHGLYHKQRLVPFGEYVPLEDLLRGLIRFFDLPMSGFSAGGSNQQPLIAGDLTLAPFICYEIVYPSLVNSWLPQADILVTISNDAWFGESIGPLQHLQMAQMRALEAGRFLLRSTGSGVSAIIDNRGHIVTQSRQFEFQILSGQATVFTGSTPFALFGTLPIIIISFAICTGLQISARQTKISA